MRHQIPQQYRLPLLGRVDRLLRNCFLVASGLGVLVLIVIAVTPAPRVVITKVEQVPERFAKLLLEEPRKPQKPTPEAAKVAAAPAAEAEQEEPKPAPAKVPAASVGSRRTTEPTKVAADKGTAGREQARREVTQQVASVTGSLNQVLADLSTSLASTKDAATATSSATGSRRRTLRAGRSAQELGQVGGGVATAAVDASGSTIGGALIQIESVSQVAGDGVGGTGTGGTGGGSDGSVGGTPGGNGSGVSSAGRSNASLLAVVRRYAPGIQFCYDNELKRNPSLRGKIVLGLVVAASGEVTDVQIVEDTLAASTMRECVLAQVRAWRFPAIAEGSVGFRTPFVFTPPR